ncbi:glucuronate isomerase [Falsihalocynthiibacter arcticus]|uniref:Uronate isomerase n=1 Tax=Falsihalocynthiibacter arcticus TaxID=1579316 RepID=A0A126V4P5_9RHOB|nr:glucuronate isomerase [Falsihalocynthiibacter arcticus]AML53282.1 glucuronate isomerase [Falsihalocynthiibacter arcticus]
MLNENRFFPVEATTRAIAQRLFHEIEALPLICPHGHTDPSWFSGNAPFADPAQLLIVPDHYIVRMMVSQGIPHSAMGVPTLDGAAFEMDSRKIWRLFAENYTLFRSTPVRHWMDYTLENQFGIEAPLRPEIADAAYDQISEKLNQEAYRPRALYEAFNIEVLATTDSCLDDLAHHKSIAESSWSGRVVPTYRPDAVTNPDISGFVENIERFGEITGENTATWDGLLRAHQKRRQDFIKAGATATDHGHPSATTCDLTQQACRDLYAEILAQTATEDQKEMFRGQMLTEMARLSVEDGLVMQIHPGSDRNHSPHVFKRYGSDKGFDIPKRVNFVEALKPLLNILGHEKNLSIILFTLDESTYARELAPLAAAYPCLKLGPAWWFSDSPDGMMRYRNLTTETAGYYNTVGFNDDTRAFPSIPARHDMARRVDCAFLATQVAEHRLLEDEAVEVAIDLAYRLAKRTYGYEDLA